LKPDEVQSRLKTLALTLDTRGWAIKNVDVNLNMPGGGPQVITPGSDRLVGSGGVPAQMPVVDVHAADDILDENNNPTAKKFQSLMQEADAERKRTLIDSLKELVEKDKPAPKKTKRSKKKITATDSEGVVTADESQAAAAKRRKAEKEAELQAKLAKARAKFTDEFQGEHKKGGTRHKVLDTPQQAAPTAPSTPEPAPVTVARQTVNMELAQSGSAFSVATLSQLANRPAKIEQTGPNEVTISLH